MKKSILEASDNKRDLGAIAVDNQGNIVWGKTSEVLLAAYHNGNAIGDCLEWNDDNLIGELRIEN
jgi:L-asparaginase